LASPASQVTGSEKAKRNRSLRVKEAEAVIF
jgi:hypothetical protein